MYESFVGDSQGPKRGERILEPASGTAEREAEKAPPELQIKLFAPRAGGTLQAPGGKVVANLVADTISATAACITAPRYQTLAGCKLDSKSFSLAKAE